MTPAPKITTVARMTFQEFTVLDRSGQPRPESVFSKFWERSFAVVAGLKKAHARAQGDGDARNRRRQSPVTHNLDCPGRRAPPAAPPRLFRNAYGTSSPGALARAAAINFF